MKITQGQQDKSRLGRLLVNRGLLEEWQLERGLEAHRDTGQRLGEILVQQGWLTDKALQRALTHQARYRNAGAFVTMVALPFQPLASFAATHNAQSVADNTVSGEFFGGTGLTPLSDEEMTHVSGQGFSWFADQAPIVETMPHQLAKNDTDALKGVAGTFVPVLAYLDSDLTITGVSYDESRPRHEITIDGGLKFALPDRIEHVQIDNIRVTGSSAPSMGSVSLHDVRFHPDSSITLYSR